jgi:predicted Zn-dependent protease
LLSEALRGLGRWDEAADAAEAAAKSEPGSAWPLVVLAKAERYRDPARALAALARAQAVSSGDHYVAGWRGEVLLRLGRAAEAAKSLDAAVKLAPAIAWMRALRGEARRAAGEAEAGLADVLEAFRIDGHFSCGYDFLGAEPPLVRADARLAWVYAWRGGWRRGLGADGADADFTHALALDAACAWARAWRGEARLASGRAADAAVDLEGASKAYPKWADASVWLGRARLESGNAAAALEAFRAASRADKRHALAKIGEAVACEALGRAAEAKKALAAAVKLDPRLKESLPS